MSKGRVNEQGKSELAKEQVNEQRKERMSKRERENKYGGRGKMSKGDRGREKSAW